MRSSWIRSAALATVAGVSVVPVAVWACRPLAIVPFEVGDAASTADEVATTEVLEVEWSFSGPDRCESNSCNDITFMTARVRIAEGELPVEGSFDMEDPAAAGLMFGARLLLEGNVPCPATGDEMALPTVALQPEVDGWYRARWYWGCEPADVESWAFVASVIVLDVDGDAGEPTGARYFEFTNPMEVNETTCPEGSDRDGLLQTGGPVEAAGNPVPPDVEGSGPLPVSSAGAGNGSSTDDGEEEVAGCAARGTAGSGLQWTWLAGAVVFLRRRRQTATPASA
jgi:hypothetical protein